VNIKQLADSSPFSELQITFLQGLLSEEKAV
jgi:hypothetical protein